MDPTPPAAECTSTERFRVGGAAGQNCASAIACNAVPATDGSAAASAAESALGVLRHWLAGTSSRDEYAPKNVMPKTASPARRLSTPSPTASTTPLKSNPGTIG